ncbi:small ubiquitin-related modifier [Nematocida parisii]|uniref:Ubiquitin-like domain-containing protein n=1 Tax=Nematocida parisii (strain ERTm3) TaxID=935791 RepID=I3EDF4_NEMP3|nr:uncharacterized protein NEPG_00575 [Nematocida parisii ERTm1]EIJ87251.1 hypothetical protein NEQG_02586 [Nematocida parisii ERTm3]KAI5126573.1 small ubiquitin-related modifier [Nematocida parisii]KAI5165906.1 small ubiquitin-related modifier [Nematocida sp. AWRm79]KAI5183310.1 small ubiquitin-related modifier [Nematocida sp. AWRm78]OAG33045.1 small ubiquitin-related modifier [Nematocida sp. ERTm5]|eukprot:XP_013058406.1 hypothetical protein NEPG_00575 [Nematocida parisii ERTm1]
MHIQEVKEKDPKPTVQLKISDQSKKTYSFVMKRKTKLSKLFKEYTDRSHLDSHKLRFTHNGITVSGEETADSLGLKNDDVLEVFSSQVGG